MFNIVSGSEANMTTPCEMEFFNFLWLIWDHYLPLTPSKVSIENLFEKKLKKIKKKKKFNENFV